MNKSKRELVFNKYGGRCAYCGQRLGNRWHVDHLAPLVRKLDWSQGGARATGECYNPENHKDENLMPACAPCNIDKSIMTIEAWRQKLQESCNVLRRNNPTYRHALRFGMLEETGIVVTFFFELAPVYRDNPNDYIDIVSIRTEMLEKISGLFLKKR